MADLNQPTLGSVIFADIENNEYLNKLYEKILYNYSLNDSPCYHYKVQSLMQYKSSHR